MRTRPHEDYRRLDLENDETLGFLDWKEGVQATLESIDSLLVPHGLEVVQYDTQQDAYAFKIERLDATVGIDINAPLLTREEVQSVAHDLTAKLGHRVEVVRHRQGWEHGAGGRQVVFDDIRLRIHFYGQPHGYRTGQYHARVFHSLIESDREAAILGLQQRSEAAFRVLIGQLPPTSE